MGKICRKCGRDLSIDEYYAHDKMADGHLNICKDCVKSRMIQYRQKNIEKIRDYDKARANSPHRKALKFAVTKRRRKEVAGYEHCHNVVARALRNGLIERSKYCQVCGHICKTEAHHNDYQFPLDVVWLCSSCHSQYHIGVTKEADEIRAAVNNMFQCRKVS